MGIINYVKTLRKNLVNLDAPSKTYAVAQSRGRMDIFQLSAHMAEHNTPFSEGTISGVLRDMVKCSQELLCDGWILDFGNLGVMKVVLESDGVCESVADEDTGEKPVFTDANIKEVTVKFTPGEGLTNLREKVTLHEVLTRKAQQKERKEKAKALADGTWKGDKN